MVEQAAAPSNGGTSIVRTSFGEQSVEKRSETASTAVAAQAQAEIQARFIMAMQRPRDDDNVRVRMLRECARPAFAKRAYYSLPRGDKPGRLTGIPNRIEGLSVRFAEAAVRLMGNVLQKTRTTYDDDTKRIVMVSAIDLETNACYERDITLSKIVERSYVKKGQTVVGKRTNSAGNDVFIVQATEDELLQKESALVSKTFRTEALRLVPADTLDDCEQAIMATVNNEDAKNPDAARKEIADGFAKLNIMPSDIKVYLGHDLDLCSPAELANLRGVYASVRDGEATWPDILAEKTGAKAEEPANASQATTGETAAPKTRGSRLARNVRGAEPTPPAAQTAPEATQQAPKGGAATQVSMPGATATIVEGQVTSVTPPAEPVIPSSSVDTTAADNDRKKRLQEETAFMNSCRLEVGEPVLVEMADGELRETVVRSKPRMGIGDIAVINVDDFSAPVALRSIRRA